MNWIKEKWIKRKLKLDPTDTICDKCDGRGGIRFPKSSKVKYSCAKCRGKGKLDWVENIIGKKNPISENGFFTGGVGSSLSNIEYITITSTSNITDFGDLSVSRKSLVGGSKK